jgi:hypothetical protein
MQTDISAPVSQLEDDIDPLEYMVMEQAEGVLAEIRDVGSADIQSETIRMSIYATLLEIQNETKRLVKVYEEHISS